MPTNDIGAQYPNDPRGWLVFASLPADVQNKEDATQFADRERVRRDDYAGRSFKRPASDTERTLLEHLGYTLPDKLTTHVNWISKSVRRRTWPQLENQQPTEGS